MSMTHCRKFGLICKIALAMSCMIARATMKGVRVYGDKESTISPGSTVLHVDARIIGALCTILQWAHGRMLHEHSFNSSK